MLCFSFRDYNIYIFLTYYMHKYGICENFIIVISKVITSIQT